MSYMARHSAHVSVRDSRGSSNEGPRSRMGYNNDGIFSSKLKVPFILFLVALGIIVLRLFQFQVLEKDQLSEEAEVGRYYITKIPAKRGTIYDRNGNILAMSQDCTDIVCDPMMIEKLDVTASVIQKHIGGSIADYKDRLEAEGRYSVIKRGVDNDVAEALKVELTKLKLDGVFYEGSNQRVYPYGSLAGQILGIVGNEGEGLTGLELYYDDILKGTDGEARYTWSNFEKNNTVIAGTRNVRKNAQDGTDIVLTIDANIQKTVERAVEEASKHYKAEMGMAMVSDPATGEILAACSTPYLDPSDTTSFDPKASQLRLVTDSYEPGSMFKVFTASIGMNASLFDDTTSFEVPPMVLVGADPVRDEDGRDTTDYMTTSDIITHSSNVGAVLLGRKIGSELFAQGIADFGIGSPTGIDYPGEVKGIVAALPDYTGEDGLTTLGSMSFGQSLAVPMVQIVRGVGAVAFDGRLTTPHFLRYQGDELVSWPVGERATSRYTASLMREMMSRVVAEGTGTQAQMSGYAIAGKTGTGEQADPETGRYRQNYFLSSFVGFSPQENPQLLCYVGLLGTSHLAASSAVPTFSTIMYEALSELGVLPSEELIIPRDAETYDTEESLAETFEAESTTEDETTYEDEAESETEEDTSESRDVEADDAEAVDVEADDTETDNEEIEHAEVVGAKASEGM